MQTNDLREVSIKIPWEKPHKNSESETWITLIEQFLACNYKEYSLVITHNKYQQITDVTIKFANVEDATFFKMTKYR